MTISDVKLSTTLASFIYGRNNAAQVSSVTSTGVPACYSAADNLTGLTSGATPGVDGGAVRR